MNNFHGDEAKKILFFNEKTNSKTPKNGFLVFFGCFWAYVGQPHNHTGWATSMPFASINPTNLRTNPWNFWKEILRIGDFEKTQFFWVGHFGFFLLHFHENHSKVLGYQEWGEIFLITLVSSQKSLPPNISDAKLGVSLNILAVTGFVLQVAAGV